MKSLRILFAIALLALPLGCQPPAESAPDTGGDTNTSSLSTDDAMQIVSVRG